MQENNHTVLLVDDEKSIRDIVTLILEGSGYRVLAAEPGEVIIANNLGLPLWTHNFDSGKSTSIQDKLLLSEFIGRFIEILRGHGTTAGIYAHASVGCLHVRPVINLKSEEGIRQFEAIARDVAELVLEYGGALSGEHGDGLVRSPFMRRMFGDR